MLAAVIRGFTPEAARRAFGYYLARGLETGIVDTSWPVGHPRRYGAKVDGTNVDHVAYQRAHDSLAALGGGILTVPVGVSLFGATVNHTSPRVFWQAEGDGAIIRPNAATFHLITLGALAHRSKFKNVRFEGAASSNATTQFAIKTNALAAPDDILIRDCFFGADSAVGNSLNNGIWIDGGNRWKVYDNTFSYLQGAISGCGYGVLAGTTNRLIAKGNHFTGSVGHGRHAVYLSAGCADCSVESNHVSGFTEEAFPVYATAAQTANTDNVIKNNIVLGGGQLTSLTGAISILGKCSRNVAQGNKIRGFQGSGIIVGLASVAAACDVNVVKQNDIRETAWDGISISGASNTVIRGNDLFDWGQASAGTYPAIGVRKDGAVAPDGVTIRGNHTKPGTTGRCGVFLEAGVLNAEILESNRFPAGLVDSLELNGNAVKTDSTNLLGAGFSAPGFAANVTIDAGLASTFDVTASSAAAFNFVAPLNPMTGQRITVRIRNTSGGAIAVPTWNAVFKHNITAMPATGNNRSWIFEFDGANWRQTSANQVDIPN